MPEPARLRVVAVVDETPDSRSLVFDAPPGWSYRPGQFLTLRIPSDRTGSVARSYSLSSSPHVDDTLQVTVKRAGYGSNWLCDNVVPGSEVDVMPPSGGFVPRSLDEDAVLLAAGSGITPVMSIAKSVLAAGTGRIALVYANQREESVIFADELREMVARHPDRLLVVHWLESVQGLPTTATLRELVRPFADRECFVCGPSGFMDVAEAALRELGVPRARTHVERFVSLRRNPFRPKTREPRDTAPPGTTSSRTDRGTGTEREDAPSTGQLVPDAQDHETDAGGADLVTTATAPEPGGPATDSTDHAADCPEPPAGSADATVEVELDGEHHELRWPREKRLLDLLLENGVAAPFSCREGACSACACRLETGEVRMLQNEVLEQEDLDEGIILACQSLPLTDKLRITYE
ncbi:ferredoxin--NADP reductase [Saccharopolyspora hordei]|uniref:3-ketosteroid 9alpha-monooxygenase subunit B n=1 Tax=Saccharopolyspora hordei TaxID=1838 RepID=A0A853AN04_9PSEU|nr:ferredoxin--NADP reductase [Saccharopolyspora hordei]NYI85498.1 3-ketosteroid 9alpha-monooxygenase subunit B [Saccharopolyspora hordei]